MKRATAFILAFLVFLSGYFSIGNVWAEELKEPNTYFYGDVVIDQKINAVDALAVLRAAVKKLQLREIELKAADVDENETLDAVDALWILRYSVGKVTSFPAGLTFNVGQQQEPAFSYDTGNSYNGAYEADPTADNSFVMDNTGLLEKTIYVVNSSAVKTADQRRLLVSLQGLVNRDFGRDDQHTTLIYLIGDGSDSAWLTQMIEEGVFKGYAKKSVNAWENAVELFKYQLQYCGMVLWDSEVWATANVAATICGLDGYLPVLADSDVYHTLAAAGVSAKLSLVNMFTGEGVLPGTSIESTGSAKNDAYRWALEKYYARCSSKYLAYTLDGAVTIPGTPFTSNTTCLNNHDYMIARRAFFFDLDPYTNEAACDDPNQKIGLDAETMRLIFQKRYDRDGGEFGMAMGFPPWWSKYTPEHGGGTLPALSLEPYYAELVTCYNMAMEADAAQPADMTNGSAYYKYVPLTKTYENTKPTEMLKYDPAVHYFTIYIGDYDSSAWMKKYVYDMWIRRDAKRGRVNMMWSFNPNLSYRIPLVFDYVYRNATNTDYFAAGDSGAGYVLPTALLPDVTLGASGNKRPASTGNGADKWAAYCKTFYDRFDISITGFIINHGNPFDTNVMKIYNQFAPTGSLYYNGNDDRLIIYNGVPYCQCRIGVGKNNPAYLYNWAATGMNGYNFAAYRTVNWTPSEIYSNVNAYIEYAAGQGMTVQYVDPYNFFHLIRESGQGVVIKE